MKDLRLFLTWGGNDLINNLFPQYILINLF
jgi:hypothetical protein